MQGAAYALKKTELENNGNKDLLTGTVPLNKEILTRTHMLGGYGVLRFMFVKKVYRLLFFRHSP